jgi:ribosomal-protein-alanine N-acetyltransferase
MRKGKIDVDIREFTEKDLSKLALLEKSCFADAWTMEMLKSEMGRDGFCCLLAEADGEAAGFVYGNVLFEDAELYKVAVLPDFRGKGIGRGLMNAFSGFVKDKGAQQIFLEVRVSNQAALALYLGQNFEKTRLRKRYYADGEDCLEMRKSLYPDAE